jgi:anti-sigma B factor antagonist
LPRRACGPARGARYIAANQLPYSPGWVNLHTPLLLIPLGQPMSLTTFSKDGILTVVFDDARILDETKLEELGRELIEALNKTSEERVILDFRNVKFMSSSMLGKLVQVHKKAGDFKVKMKLCSIDPEIRQVFKITRLDKLFEIEADEASARAAFMKKGWFG